MIKLNVINNIFNEECIKVDEDEFTKEIIVYFDKYHSTRWNPYELMHLCQEWAYKNNYLIIVKNYRKWISFSEDLWRNEYEVQMFDYNSNPAHHTWHYGKTRPQVVFDACEKILERK
ncbi:MAG: hypothetical protein KAI79_18550 [Bacteroidales bacterium]|nr:hypothetical protein [Bacteroidales bacterium]